VHRPLDIYSSQAEDELVKPNIVAFFGGHVFDNATPPRAIV